MPRKLNYIPGNTYGPHNLLLVKRSDRVDKYGKHKWGWYQCPDCGQLFEALNQNVKVGDACRCFDCRIKWHKENSIFNTLNKKYQPGMRVGPYDILFIEEEGHSGHSRLGRFKCPICGDTNWITRLSDVCAGKSTKCPSCYKKEHITRCIINEKDSANDLTGYKFGKLTVDYLIEQDKVDPYGRLWHCSCECGGTRDVHSRDLTSGHIWHCGCSTPISKGENRIVEILSSLDISYEREYSFSDCVNDITNKKLRFDFYLPDYNCCIEYDGIQHYKETTWRHITLQDEQRKDNIKNRYCNEKDIKLIRIPYWDYEKLDEQYLVYLINRHQGGEVDGFSKSNRQSC